MRFAGGGMSTMSASLMACRQAGATSRDFDLVGDDQF
jgi:hypothetical protein